MSGSDSQSSTQPLQPSTPTVAGGRVNASIGGSTTIHRSIANLTPGSDTKTKAQQQQSLEKRRAMLDVRHRYLLERFSALVPDVKQLDLENALLVGSKLEFVQEFFREGGSKKLFFFWQPAKEEIGTATKAAQTTPKPTLVVTDGVKDAFVGPIGAYFIRFNTKAITPANVYNDVYFNPLLGNNIVGSLTELMKNVLIPSLKAQDSWGVLTRAKDGASMNEFETHLDKCVADLEAAMQNMQNSIRFQACPIDLSAYQSITDYASAIHHPEIISTLEELITEWSKQIEQVLTDSEQMRREADEIGPHHELDHWKNRMIKFNSISEQIKAPLCRKVVGILSAVKSKHIERWNELETRIVDAAIESKDNVKYLYTLERYCEPLYRKDPQAMIPSLPGLINAIKMIYSISRYYNTSERMTSLFIKITNQMITSSKEYIVMDGAKLWDHDHAVLIKKFKQIVALNQAYQHYFHAVKKKLHESPNERQFDFSEMYIFGKFDTFCRRINRLIELFATMEKFKALEKLQIEGLDTIIKRFQGVVAQIQRKPYDILDYRKNEFDTDYAAFRRSIQDIEMNLQQFIDKAFDHTTSTEQAIVLLEKFAKIQDMNLDLESKYLIIFNHFIKRDLEGVRKLYAKHRERPPVPRNAPPISGAIMWSRQLFHHIEGPMVFFQTHTKCLEGPEGIKHIRNYNRIASALIEYEFLWHKSWYKVVDETKSGLNATIFVQDADGSLVVNFDDEIVHLIKETHAMSRLGMKIPDSARQLCEREEYLRDTSDSLKAILAGKRKLVDSLNPYLRKIIAPRVDKFSLSLEPGLTSISWNSLGLTRFIADNEQQLIKLNGLADKLIDITSCRIGANLRKIQDLTLCDLPGDSEQWSTETLLSRTEQKCTAAVQNINQRNALVEAAVRDIIREVSEGLTEAQLRDLDPAFEALYYHCNSQCYEALVLCTRTSLDILKARLAAPSATTNVFGRATSRPFFKADIVLSIPSVVLQPKLEDIQLSLNKVTAMIIDAVKRVTNWPKYETDRETEGHVEDSAQIASNKDVNKVILSLSSIISSLKKDIDGHRDKFNRFDFVWKEDKNETVSKFLESNPTISDFEAEINRFEYVEQDIAEIASHVAINVLLISAEPLKLALTTETRSWKQMYGLCLNQKVKKTMEQTMEYIEAKTLRLSRKVADIDDLRNAVKTLSEIRESEVDIDMKLQPVEEAYILLAKHSVSVSKEETEMADSLRYSWNKLKNLVTEVQENLSRVQPVFKSQLVQSVQKFKSDVNDFAADYNANGPMVSNIAPKVASERLNIFQRTFDELNRKWETYTAGEELFCLPITEFPSLVKAKKELRLLQSLYSLYNDVLEKRASYYEMLWSDVNFEKMNVDMADFQNKIKKLPKSMKDWDAFIELRKIVDDLTAVIPLLEMMSNKALQTRHWDQIMKITGTKINLDPDLFYLRNLMDAPILKFREDIEEICVAAVKEGDIEIKLKAVVNEWDDKSFVFAPFKNRGNIILKSTATAEIIAAMEDSLMTLGSLLSNRYNAPFKATIQSWVQNLSSSSEVIENWLTVQNLWIYLEAVFVGGDIAKQLPKEAKRFQNIDKSWLKIMQTATEKPGVIHCCVVDETIASLLPHMTEQLEMCQKSLSGYLESKRAIFPRFYFVSDPALLEILGQASDSHTIQAHLKSVFDNVQSVQFHDKEYDKIIAMESSEGERVALSKPMMASGNVELWLGTLLKNMQITINDVIRSASSQMNEMPLLKFLDDFPAQIGLLGIQMQWTQISEDALMLSKSDKKAMTTALQKVTDILNVMIDQTTKDLSKMDRVKYETFITIQVHHRDVFEKLVKSHVKSVDDFEWLKQCRFYWRAAKDACIVSITNVDFRYQCEYLGCTDRLVITPLTDRCFITLAQAMGMSLGGSPAGPAGTGKTETTKDMGKALGKWVVVFNCSDQMDYRGLGRIFKGLAQCGCWGCFDEFNRIELPVLSVAAQQVGCVLAAKRERKPTFVFTDGETVELNAEVGYFITMNPGYAGRVELPENLKVHFRYVAMMVPDRQIIIRVKLAGCGFQSNIILAKKFFVLYRLCEEQLSKQVHYDFGLRNILSVLRSSGAVKRANPEDSESMIIMRVLRDMNVSKLVDEDEVLFMSLVNDLFPGLTAKKATYPNVESAIEQQVNDAGLVNFPPWNLKVIQMYETCKVRHGIMVLGPTGAGKTKCIQTLMKAMSACGEQHKELRMNPKAITDFQMFGRLDVATNDWTDGIFSALWRKTVKKKGEYVWIVLDGPVDAVWIENLNSVLDDNKCLTLANGDRITMSPTCKLIFEVDSLRNASPATVSRCGMIYMGLSALTWEIIAQSWLATRPAAEVSVIQPLLDSSFGLAIQFVNLELHPKMDISTNNYITNLTTFLTGLLPSQDNKALSVEHISKLYTYSLFWTAGALLELDERRRLQTFLLEKVPTLPYPTFDVNSTDTLYEFYVKESGDWGHWRERVPEYVYPRDLTPDYSSIIVPTVDNVRSEFMMDLVAKQGKGVLLIGEPGTAKTVTIQRYIAKLNSEVHLNKGMNFSSATTPNIFQRAVESYVDKRMGTTYGPPAGKKMTIFIDDVNMPEINEWGDQITAEIVRQLMENQGMYSLDRPGEWTSILDLQFMAAMMHPGGGRNDIPARLKRQFIILNCTIPSDVSVDKIFGTMLTGHFCPERGFSESVVELIAKIPSLTRRLWQQTKTKMLPTPAKFHYIFNLRDLSRIVEGMMKAKSEVIPDNKVLLNLWEHECSRVLPDRFTNQDDIDWFNKNMRSLVQRDLGDEMAQAISSPSFFVDFMRDPPEQEDPEVEVDLDACKVYEKISSFDELRNRLTDFMKQYNENIRGAKMDLVLFEDAMKHIVRISRILRTPRGNALLVGVGGSGKQSLTRLASFIARNTAFQISVTKSYSVTNLFEDIKNLYKIAGLNGKPVSFIFTDNEVKEEVFLGYINNIMTSGEIGGLFPKDEQIAIASDLRTAMKRVRPQTVDTIENLWRFFIDRVKDNLHVVLCFSPVGDKFRARALKFPGLISGCTMDWFTRWPTEALRAVAQKYLSDMDIVCTDKVRTEVVNHVAFAHDFVNETCTNYFSQFRRRTHVTPKSYLSFLSSYKSLYQDKRNEVGKMADRMNTGLAKLVEASKSVADLQEQLVVKEKELLVASKAADVVLAEVTASTLAAEKVKDSVLKVKVKAEQIATLIGADKLFAESQLEAAKPALEEAKTALNSIQPSHIATIRKLAKPPHLIMRIMDCVLLLQKRKIDPVSMDPEKPSVKPSWAESLRLMSQSDFLNSLLTFAKDDINGETVELLEPYLDAPDFNLEGAKKVSADVAGLTSWVRAMSFYYSINKKVIPLKANLVIQERKLEVATNDLNTAQKTLDEKQAELDVFKAKYDSAISTKQALQADADGCKRKMAAATALINGLAGEKDRWTSTSKELTSRVGRLVGDVLVSTAFLSYSGPFNQTFRTQLVNSWKADMKSRGIPCTDELDMIGLLVDNTTIGEWNIQGLPTDELSIQNGIIVNRGTRYPLLVDPQGQAKSWIRNREEANKLQVTSLSNKYFRQHVEDCISQGRPLLIEDVEETLDPTLDNILEKNLIKSGRSFKVIYGDKEIDFSDTFTLYITTKLPNPNYSPEIYAKTSIIDFTVTHRGLEDQLLGRVIMREKQELETERAKLLEEINSNMKKMKQLEDNLLERLTSTKGSLVDDESLIEVLAITKTTAEEVNEKLIIAAETQKKISVAREEYRPVASRGSVLYFLIAEMSMVNCMYQTALRQFLRLFDESMEKSQASPIPSKRIMNIIDYCTFRTFGYISRSLYDEHKVMFVLLLAIKVDILAGKFGHEEFRCFVKGGAALDINNVPKKPFQWIPDMTWLNLVALSKIQGFQDLLNQITKNEKSWRAWYEKDAPESDVIPAGYDATLAPFHKLMLLRAWCLDRTLSAARQYIASSMGQRYAEAQILDFEALLGESDSRTPLIGMLSTGADPSADIESLSKKLKIDMKAISMGQGQEVHARKLVTTLMASGGWALLQNCHLGLPFLDELLSMLTDTEQVHEKFRVWITTDVTPKFPINLLQMSIKYTNEPPQGMRAGLKRTFNWLSQDTLDMSNRPQYKPLIYGISFLHSVVQERRKFGPVGWNIPYEFNQSDLATSVQFVQNHVDELQPKMSIQWVAVRYMFCEVMYGGRVTDDFDRRLLVTFGKSWFGEHMFADTFVFNQGYKIPNLSAIEDYRSFIDTLPLTDSPEVFGLHPNADISSQTKTGQKMLDTVLSIQPKDSSSGGGETREDAVKRLADDLLSKLPENYDKNKVKAALQKQGSLKPLNIFLGQEVDRIQTVLKVCRQDLKDLKLAIDGTIIMSSRLQDALDALYDARVPANWTKVSWPAMTLGLWFSEVLARVQQFTAWLFEGRPLVFWLSGFFNPQGFLTAIRQEITRAHTGWALDSVKLTTEVVKQMKEDITQAPHEGVYIHGLFIEGAGWDRKNIRLTESQPKVIYQAMPVIHISATNSTDDGDPKLYRCPVYKRPRRTDQNYIFDVELRTVQNPDYWTMRGVALLASTS